MEKLDIEKKDRRVRPRHECENLVEAKLRYMKVKLDKTVSSVDPLREIDHGVNDACDQVGSKLVQASRKLEEMKQLPGEGWRDQKEDLDRAIDELRDAWELSMKRLNYSNRALRQACLGYLSCTRLAEEIQR